MSEDRFLEDLFGARSKLFAMYLRVRITLLIILVWLFTLGLFGDYIQYVIIPKLSLKSDETNWLLDIIVFIVFFILLSIQLRLLYNKYRPSSIQYVPIILVWITFFYFRFSLENTSTLKPWLFGKDHPFGYIDYIVLTSSLYAGLLIFKLFEKSSGKFKDEAENYFLEDKPIKDSSEDRIGFDHLLKNLYLNIVSDYYEKSFTVGIVGPWGNGKSSFINALKEMIHENDPKVLEIEFHPYLNHNSKDIISEFFQLLAIKLSPYNGKLSEKISDYSDKLLKLYKKGELKLLFENRFFSPEHQAAHSLYEEINGAIKQTGRPLIVYVDDLDRLKGDEILTVLKLIRNTANFANTVFVVAMDKDYIIRSLEAEKIPESKRFIDKFFQLEVFLPQLDKSFLRNSFIRFVESKGDEIISPLAKSSIIQGVSDRYCLFDDYVHNLRDVKRLYNQLIFEERILRAEVDMVDLINFIFLKTKFPKVIQNLYENRTEILEENNGIIQLEKVIPDNTEFQDMIRIDLKRNELDYTGYKISGIMKSDIDHCNQWLSDILCEDREILLKTMVTLFSDHRSITHVSIRRSSVFFRLIRLNYNLNDFLESEFNKFITVKFNWAQVTENLSNFKSQGKLDQFVDRLSYFLPTDKDEYSRTFLIYFVLLNNTKQFQIGIYHIYPQLGKLYEVFSGIEGFNQVEFHDFCEESIFGPEPELEVKINFLSELWTSKSDYRLWGFSEDNLYKKGLSCFKEYLRLNDDGNFDFQFYHFYHELKHITNSRGELLQKELNNEIKEFFKHNSSNLLHFIKQTLDNDGIGDLYKISTVAEDIFISYEGYKTFIQENNNEKNEEISEYLVLLKLMAITGFSQSIKYFFNSFVPMEKDPNRNFNERKRKYYQELSDKVIQIFIRLDESVVVPMLNDGDLVSFLKPTRHQLFSNDNEAFFYISYSTDDKQKFMKEFYGVVQKSLEKSKSEDEKLTKVSVRDKKFLRNDQVLAEVISIQPDIHGTSFTARI